jgi:hypothetical protein
MSIRITIITLFICSNLFGQDSLKVKLAKQAVYNDSIVTKIDKKNFTTPQGGIINCEKMNNNLTVIFRDYFKSINGAIYLHLLSYKHLDSNTIVLTCLTEGHYTPKLEMFIFDNKLNYKNNLILESTFGDAGQFEQYFSSEYINNTFTQSYVNIWEKYDGKKHNQVTDSTVTLISIYGGTLYSMNPHKFQREGN